MAPRTRAAPPFLARVRRVPPLLHAAFGWVFVVVSVQPYGGTLDVLVDLLGWLGIAWGWHRLAVVVPAFGPARTVALVAAGTALARLLEGPDWLLTALYLISVGLVMVGLAVGAGALLSTAQRHDSPLVAAQASFLRWAAVGVLVVEGAAGLASIASSDLVNLVVAAATLGLAFAVWFLLLQLLCAGRSYARVGRRTR